MTECAWRLDLQVCADVCPNAETIANGVRGCLSFGSPIVRGLSELPAAVSVECSTWNTTDVESLVAKEGGGYVSRETLGTAEGTTVDQTQIAAGDLSRKIRRYGPPGEKRDGVCGAKHRRWKCADWGEGFVRSISYPTRSPIIATRFVKIFGCRRRSTLPSTNL